MEYEQITTVNDDGVLLLTLNRPDKLNAYTAQMGRELAHAFDRASEDDAVRVIVVTGAGRGFCAGADISGGQGAFGDDGGAKLFGDRGAGNASARKDASFVEAMFRCNKPSIAAINGPAVGVGITLALPMDIRIASDDARFGFVFARRGLTPEAGSAWFLPRIVGLPQALRWCYSGKVFGADEAVRGGLVSESVPAERLLARAFEIAREIADETAPVSIALTRQLLWRYTGDATPTDLLEVDSTLNRQLGAGPDVREGVAAFFEKRKPAFPGRVSTDMPAAFPWWGDDAADKA